MTSIIKDLETVYMYPTDDELAFCMADDYPKLVPIYLRVEIDANTRDDWHISDVYMLEEESSYGRTGVMRADESMVKLNDGVFKAYVINFIMSQHEEFLQDAVNLEVLDGGETVGYDRLRASDVVDCGRGL